MRYKLGLLARKNSSFNCGSYDRQDPVWLRPRLDNVANIPVDSHSAHNLHLSDWLRNLIYSRRSRETAAWLNLFDSVQSTRFDCRCITEGETILTIGITAAPSTLQCHSSLASSYTEYCTYRHCILLSRVSILMRDSDIANLSVRPSVTFRYCMKTA